MECPTSSAPDPITVTISKNGSALDVMEASVDVSTYYRFSATYFGNTLGYSIDTINGTSSSDPCYWFFYVQEPGSPMPVLANLGVSNYLVPTDGYSIYMRYEKYNPDGHDNSTAEEPEVILFYCKIKVKSFHEIKVHG